MYVPIQDGSANERKNISMYGASPPQRKNSGQGGCSPEEKFWEKAQSVKVY